jgi:hypothetical protein
VRKESQMRALRLLVVISTVALTVAIAVSCRSQERPQQAAAAGPAPVGSIRDVMHNIVEYNAFKIFNAVAVTITAEGTDEKQPRTEEEWDEVFHAAITLAESPNLLVTPGRRVSAPEEENSSDGPEELTPKQIQAKIDANRNLWLKHVAELQNVGKETMQIVTSKNAKGLFEIGEKIDRVCENCHLEFWYPGEAAPKPANTTK